MKIRLFSLALIAQLCTPQISLSGQAAQVGHRGGVAALPAPQKPGVPALGATYTIGQLWTLINTSNPAQSSNFILPTLQGRVLRHEQCWPSQGKFLDGSVSAERIPFKGITINREWVINNQNIKVQLQSDAPLIEFLVRDKRLTRTAGINQQYGQILLYFVLQINKANYRFYLNDVCPGKIKGKNAPARSIINKWDFQRSYRP